MGIIYVSTANYDLPEVKHVWVQMPEKPWTCRLCGFSTANLRHIENGYCYHKWAAVVRGRLETCVRCGIVMNPRNVQGRCIGKVTVSLRNADIEDCSDPTGKAVLSAAETSDQRGPQYTVPDPKLPHVFDRNKPSAQTCCWCGKPEDDGIHEKVHNVDESV
jgi:hypothetical protein